MKAKKGDTSVTDEALGDRQSCGVMDFTGNREESRDDRLA